ncbi:hypothetical protein [Xanthomonas sp. MUS 060]|uniref:hypothetical protein n=1 Tax=Xanthomonas sp. MUS 060 TaxID=1588031 RepID=UPI00126A328C|nr:hypothetical protein [Xanthomonas sp. MUS 060]
MSAFQFIDAEQNFRISEHLCYIEQAKSCLLSQFANIDAEAERAENEHLERNGEFFDPEWHDAGDIAEAARDHAIEFYHLLNDRHERTRHS